MVYHYISMKFCEYPTVFHSDGSDICSFSYNLVVMKYVIFYIKKEKKIQGKVRARKIRKKKNANKTPGNLIVVFVSVWQPYVRTS